MAAATPPAHRWRFSRAGGFDQARLEGAADLREIGNLDRKLWAALACPAKGLEIDERTLALVDTDGDGRIRAPEVVAAVRWCDERLKDLGDILAGREALPLDRIRDGTEAGRAILASARRVLRDLGRAEAGAVTPADVADLARALSGTRLNGDGVVPADAAEDPKVRKAIEDVIACVGSVPDRSGKPGVDAAKVEAFFAEAGTLGAWAAREDSDPAIRPLGDGTAPAADAWRAVRAKVDDWFARCRLASFDPRALAALNRREEEYLAVAAKDLTVDASEVAGFPISRVEPGKPLPLGEGVNPAWAAAAARLRDAAVAPLLGKGKEALTEAEWTALGAKFAAREAWLREKPATSVEKLGLARVRELLVPGVRESVAALVAADRALEGEFKGVEDVERLARYHRDLHRLLSNFVNFRDFYSRERPAAFQAGTLYLDARSCELCVRVQDPGKHAALAGMSRVHLAYCDCTRPAGERMTIAAAFTGGDSDHLMPGRNGLFIDRKGRDWDATITRLVENPISIRQAFWAPYKKLVRLVDSLVAKRAAAAEAASDSKVGSAAEAAAHADKAKPPEPRKIDVGTVAALGVAFGAIGTLVTTLIAQVSGLFSMPFWILCLAFAGILLVISGPSMLVAWLKLRQRNLGPILDAEGWAVNGRVRLTVRLGSSLTRVAALPPGTLPAGDDPFGERPSLWPKVLAVVVAIAFLYSFLDSRHLVHRWTGGAVGAAPPEEAGPGPGAPKAAPSPGTPK